MVDYPLNDEDDLRSALSSFGQSETPGELKDELKRAARRTKDKFSGGKIDVRLYKEEEDQREFDLGFTTIEVIDLFYDDDPVPSDEYQVSGQKLKVVDGSDLDQDLEDARDWNLRAKIVPKRLKDFELDYATLRVVRNHLLSTNDDITRATLQEMRDDLESMEKAIKRKTVAMADPELGEHANNINRERKIL